VTVDQRHHSKETRLALLVAVLAQARPGKNHLPSLTTSQIRRKLPFYEWVPGDAAEQKRKESLLSHDLDHLENRRMIRQREISETDELVADSEDKKTDEDVEPGDRPGSKKKVQQTAKIIELQVPEKPEGLFLTPDEHEALAFARRQLRPGEVVPLASPFRIAAGLDPSQTIAENAMDVSWCIFRYLEECGGEVSIDELASALEEAGIPHARRVAKKSINDLSVMLDEVGLYRSQWVGDPEVEFLEGRKELEGAKARASFPPRQRRDEWTGLAGWTGVNALSRSAYTPAEADERLRLIDEALADGSGIAEEDKALLRSAEYKLRRWQDLLAEAIGFEGES